MQSAIGNRQSAITLVLALAAGLASAAERRPPSLPDVRAVVRERGKAVVKIETVEHFVPGLVRRTGRLLNPFPLRSTLKDVGSFVFFLPSAPFRRLRKHVGSGVLIERDGQGEWIRSCVRNTEHFQHSRDPRFARSRDARALGHVEDHVWPWTTEKPLEQRLAIAEQFDIVAERAQSSGDGVDGLLRIELFLGVRRQTATLRAFAGRRANVERESQPHELTSLFGKR